ncbi:hypothetical protein QAD02_000233 [Eretmocerus hayati]|uniref:Uncharacterized protein n=1 Tax=Eretmocerus hayati TaxID=131215 RepID=A0ACC2NF65_9HYME|nr:hypothetical protein QAD02_000233 [Eretmocerus hayati]
MLPRLRNLGCISRNRAFDEHQLAQKHHRKKWPSINRFTSTSSNPSESQEPAYLKNPGKKPLLEMTIGSILERAADHWPNRECLISIAQSQRMTYSELLQRADKLAAGLIKLGLQKGDRIGIWGPNRIEWLVSYMAGSRAGLIVAGINPYYRPDEFDYCIEKIGAKAVLAPDSYRDQNYAQMLVRAKEKLECLEHAIIWSEHHVQRTRRLTDVEALPSKKDIEAIKAEQLEISPYSGCNIQFTSGTTGRPKATLLAHRSLVNNSRQAVTRLDTAGRKICLNVPYFHAFGMIHGVSGPLHVGSTVVLESMTFNPVKSIEAIVGEKCEVTFGTPTMWTNMIDVQTRSGVRIDTLYNGSLGGSPATPNLFRRIRESLRMDRIKSIYGLTETTAVCNQSLPDESHELTETTVGYISDDVELKVVDENGKIVPFGTPGELLVRGYNTMIGYWNDEESTKKSFTEDKWLKTGDQYVLRKDGYGSIVGRIKDMLIRGGENIFPKEIEDFLETHPSIVEAHAFGVHDDVYGEEICACIRLKPDTKLKKDDLVEFAKGRIAKFKIPRYVEFCEEFPKTTSGKIQKFKLREELEGRGVVPKKPKD